MLRVDNQQRPIDDLSICSDLPGQTLQCVGFGLNLDATDVAVDHGDVDPAAAMIEAKFIDH